MVFSYVLVTTETFPDPALAPDPPYVRASRPTVACVSCAVRSRQAWCVAGTRLCVVRRTRRVWQVRRECRGLVFAKSGELLSRR